MKNGIYYFAANSYEGCGHEHRNIASAQDCADRCNKRVPWGPKLYVCRVRIVNGKRSKGERV